MSGLIKDGRVVGTNVDAMTCDVELEGGGRITGIKMRRGEHVTFGDPVVICKTGKKAGAWYVVGHVYGVGDVPDGMMEGGRGIVSPSGSSVLLHPNGDVVVSDGNLSRVALIPSKNLVEMHVRNYRMISTYGSILWEPEAFNVNVGTGGSDVRLILGGAGNSFGAGEWAGGRDVGASLRVGSVFHTEIAKDGGVSMVAKDVNSEITGTYTANIAEETAIVTKAASITGERYDIQTTELFVSVEQQLVMTSKLVRITGDRIEINEADGPAVDGAALLSWLASVKVVGGKISPDDLLTFANTVLSKKVFL